MLGVMIAYAIFAAIVILILVVVFIAAGISAISRRMRQRKESAKADNGSSQPTEP